MTKHSFPAEDGFMICDARPKDEVACRMLLPRFDPLGRYLVAVDAKRQLVIGAAAATQRRRPVPFRGPGVTLHVIPPCRRRGVGRALVTELVRALADDGDEALYSARKAEVTSDDFAAWQGLGFAPCETVEHHVLPLAEIEPLLAPLLAWMRSRGEIPAEAALDPLYASDHEAVLRLHLEHLGGDGADLGRKIQGQGPGAFHPKYSRVLRLGARTIGCLLAHRASATEAVVDALIVAPEFRRGWANLELKLASTRGASALGITHFLFTTFDHYADTRQFTRRLGGAVTRKLALMMRRI